MNEPKSEVLQPAAQDAAQPRKPGCFLRGMRVGSIVIAAAYAAVIATGAVFVATPLGMVVAGGVCLWWLGLGLGSALRPHPRFQAVATVVVLSVAAALAPLLDRVDLPHIAAGCALGGLLGFLAYIELKRKRRRRWQFEPLRVRMALGLTAIGLAIGIGLGLFFCLDEQPKTFPGLEVRPPAADEDNGFVVLSDAMESLPEPDWDDLRPLLREPPDGLPRGSPAWKERALDVLARYQGILAAADEVLAKPRFVTPLPRTFAESGYILYSEWPSYCRSMRELLLIKSQLLLLEMDSAGAMGAADKVVRLGRLIVRDSGNVSGFFAGVDMIKAGMSAVRDAAASPSATSELASSQHAVLDLAGDLRTGFVHALAGEMVAQRLFFTAMGSLEVLEGSDREVDRRPVRWVRVLLKEPGRPWLKPNMTMNEVGAASDALLAGLDHYSPSRGEPSAVSPGRLAAQAGWLRRVRNPLGRIAGLREDQQTRSRMKYFGVLAEQHLTQVYLALRCYQLERGRLPEALDELAPAYIESVPPDPFTEALFVYEPAGAPSRILSVGPDQTPDPPDAKEKDDIIVELNFPPP